MTASRRRKPREDSRGRREGQRRMPSPKRDQDGACHQGCGRLLPRPTSPTGTQPQGGDGHDDSRSSQEDSRKEMYGLACSCHMCGGAAAEAPNKRVQPTSYSLRYGFWAQLRRSVGRPSFCMTQGCEEPCVPAEHHDGEASIPCACIRSKRIKSPAAIRTSSRFWIPLAARSPADRQCGARVSAAALPAHARGGHHDR